MSNSTSTAIKENEQRSSRWIPASMSWHSAGLFAVRYGIGGAMILAGLAVLVLVRGDLGVYGFASAVGAGLSVLLLNFLYRMSVSGERDREREEEARRYFDDYGRWLEYEAEQQPAPGLDRALPLSAIAEDDGDEQRVLRAHAVNIAPVGAYRRSNRLGYPLSGGVALAHGKHQALGASG